MQIRKRSALSNHLEAMSASCNINATSVRCDFGSVPGRQGRHHLGAAPSGRHHLGAMSRTRDLPRAGVPLACEVASMDARRAASHAVARYRADEAWFSQRISLPCRGSNTGIEFNYQLRQCPVCHTLDAGVKRPESSVPPAALSAGADPDEHASDDERPVGDAISCPWGTRTRCPRAKGAAGARALPRGPVQQPLPSLPTSWGPSIRP